MEIWIIGGAVVALMVYISTKIKKSAAAAFERERIETTFFSFTKPEGFICVSGKLSPESCALHSQGFGETEATETTYRAEATIAVPNTSYAELKAQASSLVGLAVNEVGPGDCLISGRIEESGIERTVLRRLRLASDGTVYDFTAKILDEYLTEYQKKVDEMLSSLELTR